MGTWRSAISTAFRKIGRTSYRAGTSALPCLNTVDGFPPSPTCASTRTDPWEKAKIIDGCITCPWHGYLYLPDSGASPPPFTEKVATFRTLLVGKQVFVHLSPLPPG